MAALAEERRVLEDGITMMRKAQLNRHPGIQEIMMALERLYHDIRSAGLQMKSSRYREKLSKDCKFYCILLELVGQVIQSASDQDDLNRSLNKIYVWYKENSSQLQLAERSVFQNAQSRPVVHAGYSTQSGKSVVVASHPIIDTLSSRPPTTASIISRVNTPMDAALTLQLKNVDAPILPSSPVSPAEAMPEAKSLQGSPDCDDNAFIEKVTAVNTSKPTCSSKPVTASRGNAEATLGAATPRKLLPAVPFQLEVNKVVGHPSDVYPELFTQLLVGSYVSDMDSTADFEKTASRKLPRWQTQSLEEFFATTDKSPRNARGPVKNLIPSAQTRHLSRPKAAECLQSALAKRTEDITQERKFLSNSESQCVQNANVSMVAAKKLHLGDVIGMADFASAEISYEKSVDMLLAGTAIRSGLIQPTFSILPRSRGMLPKEEPRKADVPLTLQESPVENCATPSFVDASAVELRQNDNLSRSSNHKASDERLVSAPRRKDRGSSCRSAGRLIKNVRSPLGNVEALKALDVNDRVPEASSHQTTQVDNTVMTKMFQVQRLGRPGRLKSCRRYQPDQYFDPSRPLHRPREEREISVSFHDEESYCYYDDDEVYDSTASQEGPQEKSKEYISIVFPFTSLIKSAAQAHSKPISAAPQPGRSDVDRLSDCDVDDQQQPAGGRSSPVSPDALKDDEDYAILSVHRGYSCSPVGDRTSPTGLLQSNAEYLAPMGEDRTLTASEAAAPDKDDAGTAFASATSVATTTTAAPTLAAANLPLPRTGLQTSFEAPPLERVVVAANSGSDGWGGGFRVRQPAKLAANARAGLELSLTATRFRSAGRTAAATPDKVVALPPASNRNGASAICRRSFALHRTSPSIPTPYGVVSSADEVSVATVPRKMFIPELERAARSHTKSFEYLSQVNSLRDIADYRTRYGIEPQQQQPTQPLEETLSVRPAFSKFAA